MVHVNPSILQTSKWPQRLAACLAAIAMASVGTLGAWTSPALPDLQQNNTAITDEDGSWIGSLGGLGALIGSLPAGLLADRLGRRTVLLGLTLPFLLGWVIVTIGQKNVMMLYTARFILGLATGASSVVAPLYTEEISETIIRGELGSYLDFAIAVDILYVYAFGAFVSYIWLCISCLVLPLFFAVTFFWMPESPMYLLSKDRKVEAEESLRWLRNVSTMDTPPGIKTELIEMEKCLKKPCDNSKFFNSFSRRSPVLKSLFLVVGLNVFKQLTGICPVIYYTVDIFRAAGSELSPYYCTLIVGAVELLPNLIAIFAMDRLGRRIILLTSGVGMAISHLILSGYFLAKDLGSDVSFVNWLPLLGLNLYIMCYNIGFGPVPFFMSVELCTGETRGWITSVGGFFNWLMVFLLTKVFFLMVTAWGQAVTYGVFSVFCVGASVFVFTCIPETKGKSRDEIQAILSGKKHVNTSTQTQL